MQDFAHQQLKGYKLLERIGAGGFGAVYRAQQSTIDREVAIKVILPGHANHPEFIRRFEAEAHLVARLEHHHIVPLYDYWRDPDGAYLVMRWLRGGSLSEQLQAHGAMGIEDTVLAIDQITGALHLAHRNQVIHRDIKPGNILLDEDGNVFIADFGIAKDHTMSQSVTQADAIVGSPDYLSPEQARNEPVTPRTDIYSLGVVLYEMIEGRHPFPGETPIERLYRHLNEPLPPITHLDDRIQDAVNNVIQKATAKDPMQRFQDVMEMAQALKEAARLDENQAGTTLVELLTPREQEVLKHIIAGRSNREIADDLVLSLATIKTYVNKIYRKLNVRSRVQAIVKARELDLIVGKSDAPATSISHIPEPENPYKGLRAFQAADAQDFFGREKLINKLLKRLQEDAIYRRFLAVVGPSGSGKSSTIKAGLIPALWRGDLHGSENWYIVDLLPGRHPLDELEVALTRIASRETSQLNEQLARDERGLVRAANLILPDNDSELLIVIDQFEEVFTLVENEAERQHFLNLLRYAITEDRSRVRVVVTLRADYYDRPLQYPDFGKLMQNRVETVLPLSADELEQVIRQPSKQVGVTLEDGLISQIVSDVHYQPGALPLLQYALTELFERRDGRRLTLNAYEVIGRTGGALAKRADEIYAEGDKARKELIRQLFLRLVTLGEGAEDTRRRVERSELLAITPDDEAMDEIIDLYAGSRLLLLDRDLSTRKPTVEVAHEAILREWERLRNWINHSREEIKMQQQLSRMAEEWLKADQDPSYLASGLRLEQMAIWADQTELALTEQERDFLNASIAERDHRKEREETRKEREAILEQRSVQRLRWLVALFAVASIIAVGLSVFALSQRSNALEQAEVAVTNEAQANQNLLQAQDTQALFLADLSRQQLESGRPQTALLVAVESLTNHPEIYNSESHQALLNALTYPAQDVEIARLQHDDDVLGVLLSHDEERILSWSRDKTLRVWDTASGEELQRLQHEGTVAGAALDTDNTRLVTWSRDNSLIIWDVQTGSEMMRLSHDGIVFGAVWNQDSSRILSWSGDGTLRIWDAETGREQIQLVHDGAILGAALNQSGTQLVTWVRDNNLQIWDVHTGERLSSLPHAAQVLGATWNVDGTRLLSWAEDNSIHIWDIATGTAPLTLEHDDRVMGAVWNADETQILSWSIDQTIRIWDIATGTEITSIRHNDRVLGAIWNADETQILSWSVDETVRIWEIATAKQILSLPHNDRAFGAAWNNEGTQIFSWSADDTIRLWDTRGGAAVTTIRHNNEVLNAMWNHDETQILSGGTLTGEDWVFRVSDSSSGEVFFAHSFTETTVGGIKGMGWSPDGKSIWSGPLGDNSLHLLDAKSGTEVPNPATAITIYDVQWNPNSDRVGICCGIYNKFQVLDSSTGASLLEVDFQSAIGDVGLIADPLRGEAWRWNHDGTRILVVLRIWEREPRSLFWLVLDAETGEIILQVPAHEDSINGGMWNADESAILTWSEDATAQIWDAQSGEHLLTLEHDSSVQGAMWNADGTRILSWTEDGMVQVWDAQTGAALITMSHDGRVFDAGWNSDETRILSWSTDGSVRVWDAQTGEILSQLNHKGPVRGAAWNATEMHILSWAGNNRIQIWDADTGQQVLMLEHDGEVIGATWNRTGTRILSWSADGTARVWLVDIDELMTLAEQVAVRDLTNEERHQFFLPER